MPHLCACAPHCMQLPGKQALQPNLTPLPGGTGLSLTSSVVCVLSSTALEEELKPNHLQLTPSSPLPIHPSTHLPWCLFYLPWDAGSYSQPSSSDFSWVWGRGRRTFCNSTGSILEPWSRTGRQDMGNRAVTLELASWPNSTTLKLQSGHLGSISQPGARLLPINVGMLSL